MKHVCGKCKIEMGRVVKRASVQRYWRIKTPTASGGYEYSRKKGKIEGALIASYECPSCQFFVFYTTMELAFDEVKP